MPRGLEFAQLFDRAGHRLQIGVGLARLRSRQITPSKSMQIRMVQFLIRAWGG